MKATLKFDLSNEDDNLLHIRAIKSSDLILAIWDICQLRKKTEREFESINNSNNDVFDGINAMSKGIYDILNQYNININDLI